MAKVSREALVQRHKRAKANARAIKAEMRTVWQRWLKRFTKAKRKAEAARAKVSDAGFQDISDSEISSLSGFETSSSGDSSSSLSAEEAPIDTAAPAPVAKAKADIPPKAKAKGPPARPCKANVAKPPPPPPKRPEAAPVPKAPSSKRIQNADGIFYPGFDDKNHPKYCGACDQLLRGYVRATVSHKPTCEWRQRKVPAKGKAAAKQES